LLASFPPVSLLSFRSYDLPCPSFVLHFKKLFFFCVYLTGLILMVSVPCGGPCPPPLPKNFMAYFRGKTSYSYLCTGFPASRQGFFLKIVFIGLFWQALFASGGVPLKHPIPFFFPLFHCCGTTPHFFPSMNAPERS